MQRFLDMVENNVGSSELDADEINHGALPDEQACTKYSHLKYSHSKCSRRSNSC